jgi:hypothetical protein
MAVRLSGGGAARAVGGWGQRAELEAGRLEDDDQEARR